MNYPVTFVPGSARCSSALCLYIYQIAIRDLVKTWFNSVSNLILRLVTLGVQPPEVILWNRGSNHIYFTSYAILTQFITVICRRRRACEHVA